jgi:phosphoribosylglycinamide formyltransferase-1
MSYFPLGRPARIAVMASGRGSNLEALLESFPPDNPLGHIALVISDKREAPALEKAVRAGVEARYLPWPTGAQALPVPTGDRPPGVQALPVPTGDRPRRGNTGRAQFEQAANQLLLNRGIDLILLAGFMRLLSADFVQAWQGRILNIHPSLLPQFPGLRAQRQALQAGVSESGCTVHFVDAGMDTGPVVLQRRVPVLPDDTEETLAARILKQEHQAYPEAVRRVLMGMEKIDRSQV